MSKIKRHYLEREKKLSYGNENPDKIFYIIGQNDFTCGLWWIINKVTMHLAYADEKGYIPIIDYLNYHTQYHSKEEIGLINVWEKFFQQPAGLSLNDIARCKNIILSDQYNAPSKKYLMGNTDFYTDISKRQYFIKYFKKYIRFSPATYDYIDKTRKAIIPDKSRVLGVLCRGTDYVINKPKGHPIPPTTKEVLTKVHEVIEKYKCDFIFLATEDDSILKAFENKFKNKLLYVQQKRITYNQMADAENIMEASIKINQNRYKMGLDYLCATYILSTCNCFIGTRCGGTKGVLMMTNGFEFEYIYNKGFYK